jgi:hypothetical protein
MRPFSPRAVVPAVAVDRARTRPRRCRSRRPGTHLGAAAAVCLLIGVAITGGPDAAEHPAGAVVMHELGFEATVNGWTSWYGAYGLGALGWGWCVDHGAHAPDGDFGYLPASLDGETTPEIQAAMSWAATTNEPSDPVTAAATMLVLHDLRRAVYPYGVIDVDRMTTANLAGFGGHETDVLTRARRIKADALAHTNLRAPFSLALSATAVAPGAPGTLSITLADASGTPVAGMPVTVVASGARLTAPPHGVTDASGAASFTFSAAAGANDFVAWSVVPDPRPRIFGSSTVRAQRIIQPARLDVSGATSFRADVPSTTSTSTSTTSTTSTSTTSSSTTSTSTTSTSTTSTTRPPPTTTSTTRPPSTTTTTRRPATTTTTAPPTSGPSTTTSTTTVPTPTTSTSTPGPPPPPPSPRGSLPVTGSSTWSLVLIAAGLVLAGAALRGAARGLRPDPEVEGP